MSRTIYCGPYICRFPAPEEYRAGDRWTCPNCDTTYQLSRPKPARPWRSWAAPHGHWMVVRRRWYEVRR